jgi:hypothetical protein
MGRTTIRPSVRRCGVCGRERAIKRAAVDGDPDMCQACWKRDLAAGRSAAAAVSAARRRAVIRRTRRGRSVSAAIDTRGRAATASSAGAPDDWAGPADTAAQHCAFVARIARDAPSRHAAGAVGCDRSPHGRAPTAPRTSATPATRPCRGACAVSAVARARSTSAAVTAPRMCAGPATGRRSLAAASAVESGRACPPTRRRRCAGRASRDAWTPAGCAASASRSRQPARSGRCVRRASGGGCARRRSASGAGSCAARPCTTARKCSAAIAPASLRVRALRHRGHHLRPWPVPGLHAATASRSVARRRRPRRGDGPRSLSQCARVQAACAQSRGPRCGQPEVSCDEQRPVRR